MTSERPSSEPNFLVQMATSSRARVASASVPLGELKARSRDIPVIPLQRSGFDLIAEVKLRAPSVGTLARPAFFSAAVCAQAKHYADAGAAAISVLTEPTRFDGALEHLEAVVGAVDVPVMRKDFLVAPYQVWEARAAGASGVLVIAAMLQDGFLAMLDAAAEAGLFVLIEAFDEADLVRATAALQAHPGALVGVNTRNLRTLEVDPKRLQRLSRALPICGGRVAESGLNTPEDVTIAARLGYDMALVGSALMRSADPAALARAMISAGRNA